MGGGGAGTDLASPASPQPAHPPPRGPGLRDLGQVPPAPHGPGSLGARWLKGHSPALKLGAQARPSPMVCSGEGALPGLASSQTGSVRWGSPGSSRKGGAVGTHACQASTRGRPFSHYPPVDRLPSMAGRVYLPSAVRRHVGPGHTSELGRLCPVAAACPLPRNSGARGGSHPARPTACPPAASSPLGGTPGGNPPQ